MDGLYVRVLADPLLSSFLAGVDMDRLKSRQFAFVSQATGCPHQYVGSLPQAHARLRIEQRHFDAFAKHMRGVLQLYDYGLYLEETMALPNRRLTTKP